VTAPFRVVTPIIGSIIGSNLVLHATADAQCLVVPAVTYPSVPAPNAAFTANPISGTAPLDVSFDASSSSAVGATITSYAWSFGGSGAIITHTFAAGTYTVVLTVTDSRGQTDIATTTITVGSGGGPTPAPTPTCPKVSFTTTDKSNRGHPHRMDLDGSISDGSSGWTWTWSGAITGTGQNLKNIDFAAGGPQSVTLTAVKAPCAPTVTQTVNVP
jgi:PKD repeat protein